MSWDIENDVATVENKGDEIEIDVVSHISNRDYTVELFAPDCMTDISDEPLSLKSAETTGCDDGYCDIDSLVIIDPAKIGDSSLFTATSDGGIIQFCVVVTLMLDASGSDPVNFVETVYTVNMDSEAHFSVPVSL
jgi:hypothetical protein